MHWEKNNTYQTMVGILSTNWRLDGGGGICRCFVFCIVYIKMFLILQYSIQMKCWIKQLNVYLCATAPHDIHTHNNFLDFHKWQCNMCMMCMYSCENGRATPNTYMNTHSLMKKIKRSKAAIRYDITSIECIILYQNEIYNVPHIIAHRRHSIECAKL